MHELTRLIVRLFKFVRPKRSDTNFATRSETTLPEKEKEEKSLVETYPCFGQESGKKTNFGRDGENMRNFGPVSATLQSGIRNQEQHLSHLK